MYCYRITGDPQKVEHAKQLVYELIAEKEMQLYNRGTRNFSSNNSFSQDGNSESGEVSKISLKNRII